MAKFIDHFNAVPGGDAQTFLQRSAENIHDHYGDGDLAMFFVFKYHEHCADDCRTPYQPMGAVSMDDKLPDQVDEIAQVMVDQAGPPPVPATAVMLVFEVRIGARTMETVNEGFGFDKTDQDARFHILITPEEEVTEYFVWLRKDDRWLAADSRVMANPGLDQIVASGRRALRILRGESDE